MFKTPISVLVLIHTADLKVLLIERADKHGFWQSVTGSVEVEDAHLIDTAIREVMEETGIDALQYKLTDWQTSNTYEIYPHWRYRYAPGVTENIEHQFGLELPEPVAVKLA
ncbi:MAG TPA: dihydroneopterin triphosphate diphosphatase, partial [Methyloradius sp.]